MVRLSNTFLRNASASDHFHTKGRRQRGLAIEHMLIALLVAFAALQFLLVIGAKAS